ncbi:MAG: hypothetical protein ACREFB_17965 [Stellaceae bacterium]
MAAVSDNDTRRVRLAALDTEIARLRYRHDIAMSAFRFEEATAFGAPIAALERERTTLAAALPPAEPSRPTPPAPLLAPARRGRPGRRPR